MFVRKSRLIEATAAARKEAGLLRAKLGRACKAALSLGAENERLRAELAAASGSLGAENAQLRANLVNLRCSINRLSCDAEGPRCVVCGVPIEDGPSDLCYGCS